MATSKHAIRKKVFNFKNLTKKQWALIAVAALVVIALAVGIPVGIHEHQQQMLEAHRAHEISLIHKAYRNCEDVAAQFETNDNLTRYKFNEDGTLGITEQDWKDITNDPEGTIYECVLNDLGFPKSVSTDILKSGSTAQVVKSNTGIEVGYSNKDGYTVVIIGVA